MPVFTAGSLNLASLVVDDVYVVVSPPASTSVKGVDTGIVGLVGTASWGPLNQAISVGSPSELVSNCGPISMGARDLVTDALIQLQHGIGSLRVVRVSDGTDAKATGSLVTAAKGTVTIAGTFHAGDIITVTVGGVATAYTVVAGDTNVAGIAASLATALNSNSAFSAIAYATVAAAVVTIVSKALNTTTLTSAVSGAGATVTATASGATLTGGGTAIGTLTGLFSGTDGNNISATATRSAGWSATTPLWDVRVSRAGDAPSSEVYSNIPESTFAASLVTALANGQNTSRGPSDLVRFTAGAGTGPIAQASVPLTGGSNGATNATTAQQIGSNATIPETGMYALQGQGVQHLFLCGAGSADSTGWSATEAFGKSIGAQTYEAFPASTTTAAAVAAKRAAGIDSEYTHWSKDWVQFFDTKNNQLRFATPAAYSCARKASLTPEQSPGNKPMVGVTATERTLAKQPYTPNELKQLMDAGIAVITNPCPGGNFFGLRHGLNGSSDPAKNGMEYTSMTNFLAYSFNQSFGQFIERVQSAEANDPCREEAEMALISFLAELKSPTVRMIQDFSVDMSFGPGKVNTPQSVSDGFMKAVVRVKYLGIVRFFVITLIGGKTVDVAIS